MPHIHEKVDFTAEVLIVYNNKVLLRKHDKYGIWLSVGGHIELDEDPNIAAIREVKEEVGLDIKLYDTRTYSEHTETYQELIPPLFLNRHRINDTHEHVSHVYLGTADTDSVTNISDEVAEDMRWFSLEDLENSDYVITDRIKFYAKTAIEKLAK